LPRLRHLQSPPVRPGLSSGRTPRYPSVPGALSGTAVRPVRIRRRTDWTLGNTDISKEGDQSLSPSKRIGRHQWPSVVSKLDIPKARGLYGDARWWLTNSGNKRRFVVIVKVKRDPFTMEIGCGKMAPPRYETRNTPPLVSTCDQHFKISVPNRLLRPSSGEDRTDYDS